MAGRDQIRVAPILKTLRRYVNEKSSTAQVQTFVAVSINLALAQENDALAHFVGYAHSGELSYSQQTNKGAHHYRNVRRLTKSMALTAVLTRISISPSVVSLSNHECGLPRARHASPLRRFRHTSARAPG